ncbi:unnamed protein product [Mytilus coruscus]|uniref:Endonuclease/exonuclease/phosphatase domain-containing protein n=1 Tax=Mytilus coruscus TaxID=42192 RepID=A0A6J8CNB4_MYTCO|nr:unnamed protein product [Mytilus coruscus]
MDSIMNNIPETSIANYSLNKTTSSDECRQKTVTLNLDKAVSKKILDMKREVHIEYEQTKGGVVGTADAVTFELIKNAIPHYFNTKIANNRHVKVTEDQDRRGLTVKQTPQDDTNLPTQQVLMDQPCKTIQNQNGAKCSKCKRNVQTRAFIVTEVNTGFTIDAQNCLNLKYKMMKSYPKWTITHVDIILLQEHWLFDHELNLLDELNTQFSGKGKSIDSGKNTCDLLIKSVRGYGGVAIIWDHSFDQYVKPIIDGNNRIQCIELALKNQILLVSAYLPTKAEIDKFEEFSECIDQLFEIIQKYELTHNIVIGGDFNEDISKINNPRRALKLKKKIIDECNMKVDFKGPTFINVRGEEISEINYFIYKTEIVLKTTRLTDVASNVSDH